MSLQGPAEKIDGELVLLIPLEAGGAELAESGRGIAVVEGDYLRVNIPDWLAAKLGIEEGSLVGVDNKGGKFNITAIDRPPPHTGEN